MLYDGIITEHKAIIQHELVTERVGVKPQRAQHHQRLLHPQLRKLIKQAGKKGGLYGAGHGEVTKVAILGARRT